MVVVTVAQQLYQNIIPVKNASTEIINGASQASYVAYLDSASSHTPLRVGSIGECTVLEADCPKGSLPTHQRSYHKYAPL